VIEGLDALTQLEELDMYDNLISEIRGLEKLTKLTYATNTGTHRQDAARPNEQV